ILLSRESLQQYLDIEQALMEYEKKQTSHSYELKREQLEQTEQMIVHLRDLRGQFQEEIDELKEKMGYNDNVNSVREFIVQKMQKTVKISEEENYFLEMLNKQEIVESELKSSLNLRENLKIENEQLTDQIFEGQYGSESENKLEKELDWSLEQKHQVDQANLRWRQAHMQTKESCLCLSEAIKLWKMLVEIPTSEQRYKLTVETRNKLVLAIQYLQLAQSYLPNISLPYCNPEEVRTLERAISYIFTDMQTEERYQHALNCYETTLKRAAALRQWFEQVLNSTIARDLYEITENCRTKAAELRAERIRLIRQKIKDMTGQDIDSVGETSIEMR
ncbi:uncharacterized protein B4U79_11038, partial [Dinothrombium tinctorium]